jgi:glycosyltransferase involved in cell wall biosynthesis
MNNRTLSRELRYRRPDREKPYAVPHVESHPIEVPLLGPQYAPIPANNKVSVIMTSYNRPVFVKQAIQSVLNQTYKDFELIVVDDGSSQETTEAIDSFNDYRIVKVFRKRMELQGARYCHSINRGLEFASGGFISYLTDDDLYRPHRLEVMVEVFTKDPQKWAIYSQQLVQFLDENMKIVNEYARDMFGVTRDMSIIAGAIDHNSLMHRAECFKYLDKPYWPTHNWAAGDQEFVKKIIQHWDLHPIRVGRAGHRLIEVLDVHREHPNGVGMNLQLNKSPIYTEEV